MAKNKGGRPRALTPMEEISVYRMHQDNIPITEIAYKHRVSASTIQRIVKKLKESEGDNG